VTDQAWLLYSTPTGVDAVQIPVSTTLNADGTITATVANWSFTCTATTTGCGGDAFTSTIQGLTLSGDPSISFKGVTTNTGSSPTAFGYVFEQGIVATAAPGTANDSFGGNTQNRVGITISPAPPPAGIPQTSPGSNAMVYTLSTDGGTTWLNAGIDQGPAFTSASDPAQYGPFNSAMVAGPAASGFYNAMRVDVNFTLSGSSAGDQFTWNGSASIKQIATTPEPSTAALLALGVLGIGFVRRRRPN